MGAIKVLVVDISVTNVNSLAKGRGSPRRFAFYPKLTPENPVAEVAGDRRQTNLGSGRMNRNRRNWKAP